MKLARVLFALLVMGTIAAVLTLATVNWVERCRGEVRVATEIEAKAHPTAAEVVEIVETGPPTTAERDLNRP